MTDHFRFQLARRAFNKAVARLEADRDAGLIPADEALVRYRKLYATYRTRKEDLELGAFLTKHGLRHSKHYEKLDRTLAQMAREHEANFVGTTPIHVNPITPKHAA